MEQNLPIVAKKVWSMVRVMFFILRKNISKRKPMLDLNVMMKRGKIAGKALHNLMFHRHHNWCTSTLHRRSHDSPTFTFPTDEYEFSCRNRAVYPLSVFKKHHNEKTSHHQTTSFDDHDEIIVNAVVIKALEMLTSATASPALPGFGKSPMVRQLRVTDSPFPISNGDEDSYVDEAAEKFIMKFYSELRRQN